MRFYPKKPREQSLSSTWQPSLMKTYRSKIRTQLKNVTYSYATPAADRSLAFSENFVFVSWCGFPPKTIHCGAIRTQHFCFPALTAPTFDFWPITQSQARAARQACSLEKENKFLGRYQPQEKNAKGGLTSLIQHQVVLVTKFFWSTCHKNVLISKEILQAWDLETNTWQINKCPDRCEIVSMKGKPGQKGVCQSHPHILNLHCIYSETADYHSIIFYWDTLMAH